MKPSQFWRYPDEMRIEIESVPQHFAAVIGRSGDRFRAQCWFCKGPSYGATTRMDAVISRRHAPSGDTAARRPRRRPGRDWVTRSPSGVRGSFLPRHFRASHAVALRILRSVDVREDCPSSSSATCGRCFARGSSRSDTAASASHERTGEPQA